MLFETQKRTMGIPSVHHFRNLCRISGFMSSKRKGNTALETRVAKKQAVEAPGPALLPDVILRMLPPFLRLASEYSGTGSVFSNLTCKFLFAGYGRHFSCLQTLEKCATCTFSPSPLFNPESLALDE